MNLDNITSVTGGSVTAMLLSVQTLSISSSVTVAVYGAIGGITGWAGKEVIKWVYYSLRKKIKHARSKKKK